MTELTAARVPFVHATVVRAQVPTSACPGDDAIVLPDGSIEGFVGGQCTEGSVRTASLRALQDGGCLLLRVLPEGDVEFPESPGAEVVVNPCLSGGALEIFLEPMLPPPLIQVVGTTPIADAVVTIADVLGYATTRTEAGAVPDHAAAVVIATHGRDEHLAVRSALDAGVGYVAVVASPRRGSALLDELGLDEAERARVSTPAGLDIGARTAPEVALSILAEVITEVRARHGIVRYGMVPSVAPVAAQAVDPVCGMTVTIMPDTPHLAVDGADFWFCNPGCRDRYADTVGAVGAGKIGQ
jgi:xanthine dehydrogenase accessory factor